MADRRVEESQAKVAVQSLPLRFAHRRRLVAFLPAMTMEGPHVGAEPVQTATSLDAQVPATLLRFHQLRQGLRRFSKPLKLLGT